jgi:hypothetical protein
MTASAFDPLTGVVCGKLPHFTYVTGVRMDLELVGSEVAFFGDPLSPTSAPDGEPTPAPTNSPAARRSIVTLASAGSAAALAALVLVLAAVVLVRRSQRKPVAPQLLVLTPCRVLSTEVGETPEASAEAEMVDLLDEDTSEATMMPESILPPQ